MSTNADGTDTFKFPKDCRDWSMNTDVFTPAEGWKVVPSCPDSGCDLVLYFDCDCGADDLIPGKLLIFRAIPGDQKFRDPYVEASAYVGCRG